MIPRSPLVAGLSVFVALAAHAALLVETEAPGVEIEGGGTLASAALGNSFADMAQGTASAVEAETVSETAPPTEVVEVQPAESSAVSTATATRPVTPQAQLRPTPTHVTPPVVTSSMEVAALPVQPQVPAEEGIAASPLASPVATALAAPVKTASLAPVAEALAPVEESSELAPTETKRPETRPERTNAPKVETPPEPRQASNPTSAPRGNSSVNAKAGTETGQEDQHAAQAASEVQGKSSGAGNAAATNYPGQVMRQISRQKKLRTSVKGVAHVTFSIAANGALSAVNLARSSGSPELDGLALRQIQQAAPFPPPPEGALRQYTIAIKGS